MSGESLWVLCLFLFVDGATFAFATTPLLLQYGKFHEPWAVAVAGGAASAAGSTLQLLVLRWAMGVDHPWIRRFAPSRDRIEAVIAKNPSASFVALMVARATPLPDAPLKLAAAAGRYPLGLYALAIYLGALPYYFALALLGKTFKIPTWILIAASAAIVAGFLFDRWRKRGSAPA